ncbi:MAG: DUF4199 domain-containing protein [Bacteroidota bacterium]
MATLDDNYTEDNSYIDPKEVSMMPVAVRYGLIGGLASIVLGLLAHVLGLTDMKDPNSLTNWLVTILSWGIVIGATVLAIQNHRDQELGGYIGMGRAFGVGFMTCLFIGLAGAIWAVIFFSVIDPGMIDEIRNLQIEQMEAQGLSDEDIEASRGTIETFSSPAVLAGMSFIGSLLFGALVSAVAGGVMKKEHPMA